MTLQQLKYFIETANILHYTRAAENLNVSQPSLSHALNELSKELGAPLFKKEGKKVSLTEYGEAFLPYAESAIHILSQGTNQIKNMTSPTGGVINLGYIYSVSFDIMPQIIDKFYNYTGNRNIHFNFQVDMTQSLMRSLNDGILDAVIAPKPLTSDTSIDYVPVSEQELYLLTYNDHPLASKNFILPKDLQEERLIMINKRSDLYYQTETFLKNNNIVPKVAFVVEECNSMAAFVSAQLGVAIMPQIPSLDNYGISAIPFEGHNMKRTLCILWNKHNKKNPAVQSFLKYYKEAYSSRS
ncbi:MAG: LysR family transcriptional regulator [Peptostreptococcaceae bacterium]|nr:LysR family transcriptional regulator [Peptostreptococcaceae bacterium]